MDKALFLLYFIISTFLFSQIVLKDAYIYKDGRFEKLDILVKDGKILKVGKDLKGEKEEILKDLFIYPGFVDCHLHVYGIGRELEEVNLKGVKSEEEIIERIKEKHPSLEKGKWVIGRGWDQNFFEDKKLPDSKLLSDVFKENPVILYRIDGHMLLANRKALEVADQESFKDIEKGEADFEKGLFSDRAMEIFSKAIPEPSLKEIEETLKKGLNHLKDLGFIAVGDAGIDSKILKAYLSLSRKGEIPIIVYGMLEAEDPDFEKIIKNGRVEKEYFKMNTVKVFMDGALGSWGAYLSVPYKDRPDRKGNLITDFNELLRILTLCKRYDFKVAIHSIGDEATTIALNAIERAKMKKESVRLEHLQIVKPKDLKRMKKLGVVASVQPYHFISDSKFLYERIDKNFPFLFYPWKSFLKENILLLFGSDAPVESPNFLEGFMASLSREGEAVSPEEAIKSYSYNNFVFFGEKDAGKIEKGWYANFTILNKDITKEKEGIKVWASMVKGKWVLKKW
ncbi:MAG: amidohydrolase [Thermoanaerobaculia bacterium]